MTFPLYPAGGPAVNPEIIKNPQVVHHLHPLVEGHDGPRLAAELDAVPPELVGQLAVEFVAEAGEEPDHPGGDLPPLDLVQALPRPPEPFEVVRHPAPPV